MRTAAEQEDTARAGANSRANLVTLARRASEALTPRARGFGKKPGAAPPRVGREGEVSAFLSDSYAAKVRRARPQRQPPELSS